MAMLPQLLAECFWTSDNERQDNMA